MGCSCQTVKRYPALAEIEHNCEGIGEYTDYLAPAQNRPEAILDALITTARSIWPDDVQKAEAWIKQQALRYGIAEAKSTAVQISQNTLVWIGLGLAVGWLVSRK